MTARLRSAACAAFHMERGMILRLVVVWLVMPLATVSAEEPLRDLINRELVPPGGTSWPKADDAEFLRRVSLDLNGTAPTADAARKFLADTDPDKRQKLVDSLLASPLYARHLATTLDVMLMERRPAKHVSQDEWMGWLLKSVRENKPWNVLAREILTADGDTPESRAASRFYLDRDAEPHVVTRDLGRMFFGRDMQCNQCHDSPLVADYLQRDYHGLLAIASAGYPVTKKVEGKDVTVLAERSPTDLTFESVFDKGNTHRTVARLPGSPSLIEPFHYPGEDYAVAPGDGIRAQPKFSRRAALAEQATNGTNRVFNENIANRLWAMMLGRGLVHPLDMMHPDNPAASPELLRQLGERFAGMNFDVRSFLREVALSDVYQRPFDLTSDAEGSLMAARDAAASLAEQKDTADAQARNAASISSQADDAYSAAETAMLPVAAEADTVRAHFVDAQKKLNDAQKALNDATVALSAKSSFAETLQQAATPLLNASAALPDNAELAATAMRLSERAKQAAAELPPLQQAVADKTAAVTAPTEALAAARTSLDGVMAKLQPLLDSVRAEEAKVVSARTAMQDAQLQAASVRHRLAALERIAGAGEHKLAMANSLQAVVSAEAAFNAAASSMNEYMPTVTERSKVMASAQQVQVAASTAVTTAQEQVSLHRAAFGTLTEATEALKKAIAALPGDESMAGNMSTLVAKLNAAEAAMKSSEQVLVAASQMADAAMNDLKAAQTALTEANAEMQRRQQLAAQTETVLNQSKEQAAAASSVWQTTMVAVPADLADRFSLSQLKPLSPEQMLWTIYRVTGVYDRHLAAERAELDKSAPLTEEQKQDVALLQAREVDVEQKAYDKLKGNIVSFVQIYGGAPGQPQNDFYASPDQALFTANGGAVNSWIVPTSDNTTERVMKAADPKLAAEELYLGILTRMPSAQEQADVEAFLSARPDKAKAAQELVWGLISSAEFRFNK